MKHFIFIFIIFCTTTLLYPAQQALTMQAQPTAQELKQYWAARYTGDKILFDLLEKYGEQIVNKVGVNHNTILLLAASDVEGWTLEKFEKLLQTPGIDLNFLSAPFTILTKAMFNIRRSDPSDKQLQKIILLIKYGANINQNDSYGFTPLIDAVRNKQQHVTRLLLNTGASTDGYITDGGNAGKTFFDYIQQIPEMEQVYESYRKEHDALVSERLGHINDLAQIVAAFIFTLSPVDYKAVNSALEKHNEEESRYGVTWLD